MSRQLTGSPNTQQVYEKMQSLTSYQGSANEIRPF